MSHHNSDFECPACEAKLKDAHPILIGWFHNKKKSYPNAHVSWAFRDETSQEQAYTDNKTKLDRPNSAHNKVPAMALDLFQIDDDGVGRWSPAFFLKLNQENEADRLPIFWGGKWKTFGDADHFEYQPSPDKAQIS